MVFLRLTVKVYPREQVQSAPSFSFRSFLGDRDDGSSQSQKQNSAGSGAGKPASFLLVLERPEEVTLGGLAKMIREKWEKLRPNAEPLEIKKLLDDEHDSDDLDAELTVEDVFVDKGKARTAGTDQRGTVRVIQKPAPYAPVRFPSVTQDWDAAAEDFERQIKIKKEAVQASMRRIPTITEESQSFLEEDDEEDEDEEEVENGQTPASSNKFRVSQRDASSARRSDLPLSSVENEEIPMSPPRWGRRQSPVHEEDSQDPLGSTVAATPPPRRRSESQELGDSPSPVRTLTPKSHTPKQKQKQKQISPVKRGSVTMDVSASRSISQFAAEPDFPVSNQEHARGSGSPLSPRRTRAQEQEEDSDAGETEERDRDGDVAMNDSDEPVAEEIPSAKKAGASAPPASTPTPPTSSQVPVSASRLRKRKKSPEAAEPNKEPRLDHGGTSGSDKENNPNQRLSEPPTSSPSSLRRHERAPSFSGIGRRPSLSEKPVDLAKPGLGLGITKSPPGKKPVMMPLSQESTASVALPLFSSIRRGSVENTNTPSRLTPGLDRVKQLHSALRKDSPADKSSQRRSVSFAEGDDVVFMDETPIPKSAPQTVPKGAKNTPSKMVFPDSVPKERVEQLMREANQRLEQQNKTRDELEETIRTKKQLSEDPAYRRLLDGLEMLVERVSKLEKRNRTSERERLDRARRDLKAKQNEVAKFEETMSAAAETPVEEPKETPKAMPKAAPKDVSKDTPKATPKVTAKGTAKEDTTQAKAKLKKINGSAKTSTPKANEVTPAKPASSTKKPTTPSASKSAEPASTPPSAQQPPSSAPTTESHTTDQTPKNTAPNEPPASSSEDARLPPVPRIHRADLPKTNGTSASNQPARKKPSPAEPVEVTSSEEEETESSSSSSESEDESDTEEKPVPPARSKAELLRRSGSATPSQANIPSPAASQPTASQKSQSQQQQQQQSQSQSQSWGQPINTASGRATLKSLLVDKKKEHEAKAQQAKRSLTAPKRPRDIFSPPSDDDSEDESESSSSSSSSSDDDSDKDASDSDSGSHSSADEGDIMSSGTVGKLRPARKK